MPTLAELMGGSGEKRPQVVNLKNVGEFVKGVVTGLDNQAPVFEYDRDKRGIGLQKYWVDGKPKGLQESEARATGAKPVHQLMITVETNDGLKRIPVNSKEEREAFKAAVADAGGSIDIGDVLGKKLAAREGNIKTHEFKLTRQEG